LAAVDRQIEVAKGVFFSAWTYGGTVPGPVIRATEDDLLRVKFANAGSHPHTIHFHGIHPANMDGVFEVVEPGNSFTYEFPARPYGMHLYHCHSTPLKKHIAKGLYGAFIIDPPKPRKPAQELVMVLTGFDTDGDGANNFYGVNGPAFYYAKHLIRVRRSQTVRIYIANLTEFDPINSSPAATSSATT
jgi:FtsP/CotA-like multicopper oxidase with cupredoxin domain